MGLQFHGPDGKVSVSEPERIKSGLINKIRYEDVSHDTELTERFMYYRH